MRLFWAFVFSFYALFAEEAIEEYLTSEHNTLALLEDVVNTQNGKLVQIDHDIFIDGPSPLNLYRYYDAGHQFYGNFGYGVGFSLPLLLHFDVEEGELRAQEREGSYLLCAVKSTREGHFHGKVRTKMLKQGYTNCCEALLRGEPPLLAMKIDGSQNLMFVTLGDGTVRVYAMCWNSGKKLYCYRLFREDLPNGNKRHYAYLKPQTDLLKRIWTTNNDCTLLLNWVDFTTSPDSITLEASNGQKIEYFTEVQSSKRTSVFGDHKFYSELLTKTRSSHLIDTQYEYLKHVKNNDDLFCMKKVHRPDGRFLDVEYGEVKYDFKKVKKLTWAGKKSYGLHYSGHHTYVKDALGHEKIYQFTHNRLQKLIEPHRVLGYTWSDYGSLLSYTLSTPSGIVVREKRYEYNDIGYITKTSVKGVIRELGAPDTYVVHYTYSNDRFHSLLSETRYNIDYAYTYAPETNLRATKQLSADGKVHEREFYYYDKNAILTLKIVDDGSHPMDQENLTDVTYRRVTLIEPYFDPSETCITQPKVIRELYLDPITRTRHLLRRVERNYSHGNLLTEEKVYDANNEYCFSRKYVYNNKRQLVSETNPINETTFYDYDKNGNKVWEEKVGSGKKICFEYDAGNRLIRETETYADGTTRVTKHAYDAMGNKIATIDPCGQTTKYTYDVAGRENSKTDPLGHTEYTEYDIEGHISKQIDKEGNVTKTVSNFFGKPLQISHPDGTQETFVYNIQGHLIRETRRDGTWLQHEADYLGRPATTSTYDLSGTLLKTIQKRYKGPNLISESDPMGQETHYQYDGAGRMIAKTEGDRQTKYAYDSLGRLFKTITASSVEVKTFDFLDRILEERTEDLQGNIFRKVQYSYDINGNRTQEGVFNGEKDVSNTAKLYDAQNRLVEEIDALGHTTLFKYNETDHLEKETIDPLQRRTKEIYDPLGRLIKEIEFSPSNQIVASRDFAYDPRGNKILHDETLYLERQPIGHFHVVTLYDAMGQKISETEQDLRTTSYTYDKGRLHTLTKPDGVILTHTYNPSGLLQRLFSSDGTIDYNYTYDLNGNLLHAQGTERKYDSHSRLVWEKLATGFEFSYSYDDLDRVTQVCFLDEKLLYTYSPTALLNASRYKNDILLYTFSQTSNWQKKPLQSTLGNISIAYSWDRLGQITHIQAPHFSETFAYDPIGNLIHTSVKDPLGHYESEFVYDDLDQLIQETGLHTSRYSYDSLNNRRSKNDLSYLVDTLNQITQGATSYTYDPVGRRTSEGETRYTYDALGRLLSLSSKDAEVHYTCDSFGRRLSKDDATGTLHYLYQFDTEIGSYKNDLEEFRATFGKHATFATEIHGKTYFPLRNHRGDICVLLNSKGQPVSTTRYDAYGIPTQQGTPTSPWLFSGQRLEHGLYHYDKREYDPHLGRWLTPDPIGFADGPNLYAYVHNCPLTYIDPYGLWSFGTPLITDMGFFNMIQSPTFAKFTNGFSRSAIDDASWGLSNLALGEHRSLSLTETAGYYAGTGTSLAAGMFYGNTEAKAAYYTGKGLWACRRGLSASASFIHQKGLSIFNGLRNQVSHSLSNTRLILQRPAAATPSSRLVQQVRVAESTMAKGGVYVLKDNKGAVMRTGRTNNFDRRNMEHTRNPQLSKFDFEPRYWTNTYSEKRGLEQILHDKHIPPFDKLRPISPKNPRKYEYMDAALDYLERMGE